MLLAGAFCCSPAMESHRGVCQQLLASMEGENRMQDGEGYRSPCQVLGRWSCEEPSPSARVDGWVAPVL